MGKKLGTKDKWVDSYMLSLFGAKLINIIMALAKIYIFFIFKQTSKSRIPSRYSAISF